MKRVAARFLLGAVLAAAGMIGQFPFALKGIKMMIGCWLVVSPDFPSKCKADQVLENRRQELPTIILILGFVKGLCVGFSILLAQSFGAHNEKGLNCYFMNGTYLCIISSVILTLVTVVAAQPLLQLIRTPEDIIGMAVTYITIIFIGIPVAILYNYSAGALRAVGDSKHPFYFLLFGL